MEFRELNCNCRAYLMSYRTMCVFISTCRYNKRNHPNFSCNVIFSFLQRVFFLSSLSSSSSSFFGTLAIKTIFQAFFIVFQFCWFLPSIDRRHIDDLPKKIHQLIRYLPVFLDSYEFLHFSNAFISQSDFTHIFKFSFHQINLYVTRFVRCSCCFSYCCSCSCSCSCCRFLLLVILVSKNYALYILKH